MCGLYGYISKSSKPINGLIVASLAIAMESRGEHSTGIAYCKKNTCTIYKDSINASKFVVSKKFQKIMVDTPDMVIGHTRFATTGKITSTNAHPFIKGSIVGSHNGIISNYDAIDSTAVVDSEAIFSLLNKKKNSFKALKKLKGSFALSWIDLNNPNKVHFVAHENPLSLAITHDSIFWASELYPLKAVLHASKGVQEVKFMDLRDDMVYTIDRTTLEITQTNVKLSRTTYNYAANYYDYTDYAAKETKTDNEELFCCYCGYKFLDDNETLSYNYVDEVLYCQLHKTKIEKKDTSYTDTMQLHEFKTMIHDTIYD